MNRRAIRRCGALIVTAVGTITLSACTGTTYDATESVPQTTTVVSTTLPSGTVADLLPRLLDEAASLSTVLDQRGDVRGVGQRIQNLWNVIRPQMDEVDPRAVGSFEAALALSMRAVDHGRRADADKAAKNLRILVDHYLQR